LIPDHRFFRSCWVQAAAWERLGLNAGWGGSQPTVISFCICSIIWLWILLQSPFRATSHYIHTRAQEERQGDLPSAQKFPAHTPPRGPGLELCYCPLVTGGETKPQRGAMTCLRPRGQREAESRLSGVIRSISTQPHYCTSRHPRALQLRRQTSRATDSHIFHALLPRWAFPLRKAPRLFCTVRRTRGSDKNPAAEGRKQLNFRPLGIWFCQSSSGEREVGGSSRKTDLQSRFGKAQTLE
jgi:hypothetical protein